MAEKPTAVRKLINSIELFWDAYADNLNAIAKGEDISRVIEDKTVDTVLKMTKEMSSFEQFEKIANPNAIKEIDKVVRTPIEEVSEKIKKNGISGR